MTDCVTQKTIQWIRVGETENRNFNNKKQTIVVKFSGIEQEKLLDIYMNPDDYQGPPILGLLNSAMNIGNIVTVRDSRDSCTSFDQVIVHKPNYD
ncbi:hypothetical protein AT251_14305 [Enterovibrio nigricans]|uniref:Uncharacterized protein n=1 Tax=Enterovibrio nigricans DSM 22720 TaxID=1121868 RepID=A0A1T4V9P8_9GAMM|nr:hypothetical protein [Enterovibrio nigricans]PKF50044.1 hypothetical protein AT251_14305 [Enterovibrio nigricans]SKA61658.1 hypothetical protein SAMN02745132_03503 [Enterovibrio nigricans DSM 22720]